MDSFKRLVQEIKETFNYSYDDSEEYAEYLKDLIINEYLNAYTELTNLKERD